jgi:hypothetical protein
LTGLQRAITDGITQIGIDKIYKVSFVGNLGQGHGLLK